HSEPETDPMDPAVLEALGLTPTATAAEAVLAINNMKSAETLALNRAATPDPQRNEPRPAGRPISGLPNNPSHG
ncbi:MAG TPA: hypothetical protein PLR25_10160, partial [Planctomycetaceae bacterium]|nr:hypothetical protein [Planctomycetaceae bacterium]